MSRSRVQFPSSAPMRFTARILNGYITIVRSAIRYFGTVVGIALTTVLVVVPLWFLAQRYPALYSTFALCACALFVVVLIAIRLRNRVRRDGVGQMLRRGARRIAVALLIATELAGMLTSARDGRWLVCGVCALLLLITVGLALHRHYGDRQ